MRPEPDTTAAESESLAAPADRGAYAQGIRDAIAESPADLLPEVAALAPMFEELARVIATSSRDWGRDRVDAWLWAVLVGWDCEQFEHDDTCTHDTLEEMAERHGWDDATVAKARRYRAAVHAVEAQQPDTKPEPPGGYTTRVCRHCWTGIRWDDGQWTHTDGRLTHAPEPPPLPAEPTDRPDTTAGALHADTGTPLGEHVCEGQAVGDCGCLEWPDTAGGTENPAGLLRRAAALVRERAAVMLPGAGVGVGAALADWLEQAADALEGQDTPADEPAVRLARALLAGEAAR